MKNVADAMRGGMPQATLFPVEKSDLQTLRQSLRRHLNGS